MSAFSRLGILYLDLKRPLPVAPRRPTEDERARLAEADKKATDQFSPGSEPETVKIPRIFRD